MSLNEEQYKAYLKVIQFINSDEKYMDISGGAGTGKTFLISQIVDNILQHKSQDCTIHNIAITATTNKAVAVISESMPTHADDIKTIYSFMNLKVSENFSTGKVSIVTTKNWKVHSNTLVIIDECSMISRDLFNYLSMGLDNSCKVLFVGDMNQLNPVKGAISPVYSTKRISHNLLKPMRNCGQLPLMELSEEAKQTVLTEVFKPIKETKGVIDIVTNKLELKGIIEKDFIHEDMNKRILCYTNAKVIGFNNFIRKIRGYKEPFVVGEIVSNNESCEISSSVRLYTDQILEVVKVINKYVDSSIIKNTSFNMITLLLKDIFKGTLYEVNVFEDISDRQDILKYFSKNKDWSMYFLYKNLYPDLRQNTASTVHKAQGSTYDYTIVDLEDIGTCTNKQLTARLQYVALTRPKNKLIVIGSLPERYFHGL